MPVYRSILTGLQALIAGLAGWIISERIWILSAAEPYGELAFGAALLGLFLLFRVSHGIASFFLEKIPYVSPALRSLLAGKSCIEGDWPLAVIARNQETGRASLTYLGFLSITYTGGQFKVAGRDWHPDGNFAHDFESQQSRLHGNRLQYWYHQGEGSRMRGFTEIYFFPTDQRPERHAGEFLDKEHNAARFYARRLPARLNRVRGDGPRLEAARKFWESIEHEIDRITRHPVDSDWGS